MSNPTLSEEQKARMEENRRKAMALRAAKLQQQQQQSVSTSSFGRSQSFSQNSNKPHLNLTQTSKSLPPTFSKPSPHNRSKTFYSSSKPESWNVLSGSLELVSTTRFELSIPFYHQRTIEIAKEIRGREYNAEKKNWNFPLSQYDNVVSALRKLQPAVVIGGLPKLIIDTFVKRKNPYPSDVDLSRIQTSLRSILIDFQVEGVKYAVSRGGRVLIADDMGLGKTIQALAIADYYRDEWPLLIVCPSSMRFQWVAEIQKHLKNVDTDSICVITHGKDVLDICSQVVVISYDLMTTLRDSLVERKFGVVVMDESHSLKNPKALRTKAGTQILRGCSRCVLLSGTPVLSRPSELHCQLQGIKPHIFSNFIDFAQRYCDAKKTRFGWDFSGSKNMRELSILLQETLMIRRLKSNVLSQLPPKTREVVFLESAGKKLKETSELAKALEKGELKGLDKHSRLVSYFQETADAKMAGVVQYVTDMIENREKFLVFAHHAKMLDAICTAVETSKTDYIRIDGSVPSDVRKQLCNYFQEEEKCLVAVLSIKAANTGLTFTAARLVIFAELYWNPGDLVQAEDRAHRIGQADCVLVQYLVQRGTADDKIWPLVQNKLDILQKANLSQDDFQIASTSQMKTKSTEKREDIKDYFLDDDDMVLAELDLGVFENTIEVPEKKPRLG